MSDTAQDTAWPDKALTPTQKENRHNAELIPIGSRGTDPQNFAQLVDFAKMMATARGVVGPHLLGNVGACLAVLEIANKFAMPGYMVATQTYAVDGKVAFMGQLVMSIINKHCPLEGRLKYRFEGEKGPKATSTRKVIVSGRMKDEADILEYESPMVKDVKVKNSPLWEEDQDQQLIYFASRRWQRRHWPEGLMGVYAPDELEERHQGADHARDITPGQSLMARLAAARVGDEQQDGYSDGHTETQIDAMRNGEGGHPVKGDVADDENPPKIIEHVKDDPISSGLPEKDAPAERPETASTEGAKSDMAAAKAGGKIDTASETAEKPAEAVSEANATNTAPTTKTAQAVSPAPAKAYEDAEGYLGYMRDIFDTAKIKGTVVEAWGSTRTDRNNLLSPEQIDELTKDKEATLRRLKLKET